MEMAAKSIWRKRGSAVVLFVLGSMVIGCSRRAEVVLDQRFAPPSQQRMKLKSRWAFSAADGERRRCLLDFPLPGGSGGPRDFHIYVTLPKTGGKLVVARDDPAGARGFLIQEVGLLRGKTELTAGTVRCRPVFLRPRLRRLDLSVECADGTSIAGKAYVEIDAREVGKFEREFADDIASLWSDEAQTDERGRTTAPRNAPPP